MKIDFDTILNTLGYIILGVLALAVLFLVFMMLLDGTGRLVILIIVVFLFLLYSGLWLIGE